MYKNTLYIFVKLKKVKYEHKKDVQVNWIADMSAQVVVMGIPVELRELEFKGELRVTLEPLITDIPIGHSVSKF